MLFYRRAVRERGYAIIVILIALVIVAILSMKQLNPSGKVGEVRDARTRIDQSKATACSANRTVLLQEVQMWKVNHPVEKMSLSAVEASGRRLPSCPEGGVYSLSADGRQVYCSQHAPAPSGVVSPAP